MYRYTVFLFKACLPEFPFVVYLEGGRGEITIKIARKTVACKFVTEYMAPFSLTHSAQPDGGGLIGGRGHGGGGK